MNKRKWIPYAAFILVSEAVGGLSAWLTRDGMELYRTAIVKPPLSPPGIVFPIVWGVLYLLMGIGAARIYKTPPGRDRTQCLILFFVQLGFNFLWSLLFFNLEAFGFAFVWLAALWALIIWMTLSFRELDRPAAWMQLPYILWVLFAGYLNYGVWLLNKY
mgnify:CR=1 FL=1